MNPSSGTDTDRPAGSARVRSPLLWMLFPLIGAYASAAGGLHLPAWPAAIGALCFALIATYALTCKAHPLLARAWGICFLLAAWLGSAAWWDVRVPIAPPEWDVLPPREIDVRIQIEKPFRPEPSGRYWRGIARLLEVDPVVSELAGQAMLFSLRIPDNHDEKLVTGARLQVRGVIARLDPDANEFDRSWERRRVFFRLRQGRLLAEPEAAPVWRQLAAQERDRWAEILTRTRGEQARRAGVLGAMLLGERALLAPDQAERFLLSGTMHLFAVSGLHVVAVGGALLAFFTLLPLPARARTICSLVLLGVYVTVIGLPPSALRAYVMLLFYSLGRGLWRQASPIPAVVAAALFILIVDPVQLLSLGFQLSFSVVASILLIALPVSNALHRHIQRRPRMRIGPPAAWERRLGAVVRRAIDALCISIAATAASTPLIMQAFGVFTPAAILLNPVLVPLAALVVIDAVLVLLVGLVGFDSLSLFLAHAGWLVIGTMEQIVDAGLGAPGAYSFRGWAWGSGGVILTLVFLGLSLAAHSRALSPRWPPYVRFALPVVIVGLAVAIGSLPQGPP